VKSKKVKERRNEGTREREQAAAVSAA